MTAPAPSTHATGHAHPVPPTEIAPAALGESPAHFEPRDAIDNAPAGSGDRPMGQTAAVGFMLMAGQSIATRVLVFVAQIVLAKLLTKDQFGLYGVAMSIVAYATLAQQIGVREFLVSRQRRFALWANAGFWMSAGFGMLGALGLVAAAPIAARVFQDPSLFWMLLILAAAQPTYTLTLVQEARLQTHLRFKYIALCQFVFGVLTPAMQIVLAVAGLGVYAFVLPRLIAGVVRWWMYARAAPVGVRADPQVRRWRYILGPGVTLLLTGIAYTIGPSVPTLLLARAVSTEAAGEFTFAYNLSLQVLMLLSMQIDSVLFPTLGKMEGQPERQRAALLRASRALAAVMAPVCLYQIAAAEPLVLLVFGQKWAQAILPLQIMSVGMLFAGSFATAHSMLQAHGRFGTRLVIATLWGVLSALGSIAGILLAPPEWGVAAGAIALSIGYAAFGVHTYVAAVRPLGGGILDALRVLCSPLLVGALAMGAGMLAGRFVPVPSAPAWAALALRALAIGVAGGATYLILLRVLAPGLWTDLESVAGPLIRRVFPNCGLGRGRTA